MNCLSEAQIELLARKALAESEAAPLVEHAVHCPVCRERLAAARRNHIELVRMYEAFDRGHEQLREKLMTAVAAEAARPLRPRRLGEWVMSATVRKTGKWAALLAPAACVLLAIAFFAMPAQKSAFAAALERIREAHSVRCQFKAWLNDAEQPMQTGVMIMADGLGMRFDAHTNMGLMPGADGTADFGMTLFKPETGPIYALQSPLKIAMKMNLPEGLAALGGPLDQSSPDAFFNSFRKLTGGADKQLGVQTIDGELAEGFEISARKLGLASIGRPEASVDENTGFARLWVTARTHQPLRIEMEFVQKAPLIGPMRVRVLIDQMEFDPALDPQSFSPQIPDDYRVVDIQVPPRTEETLVQALQLFADVVHRYPVSLDPSQLVGEMTMAMTMSGNVHIDPSDPASFLSSDLMNRTMMVAMGANFLQQLQIDGRQPEYFGDAVTPQDANEVLLQWSLEGNQRRVIYGDLHLATLPANESRGR